jgi:ABC-type sugar transport system ATPase subunit
VRSTHRHSPVPTRPGLRLEAVEQWFGQTHALRGVTVDFVAGETHAVIGENGSGKSTLLKIASGDTLPAAGRVIVGGAVTTFRSPRDAMTAGVVAIPQEVPLCPSLTVAENVVLGAIPRRAGRVDWRDGRVQARAALAQLGEHRLDVEQPVLALSADERQLVAIARALAAGGRTILLDEPTSSLTLDQAQRLFDVIRRLRSNGLAVVYVTQRLAELRQVADRISVIRDGLLVHTTTDVNIDESEIAALMAGRVLGSLASESRSVSGRPDDAPFVAVEGVTMTPKVHDVSFTAQKGEIVGLAGLVGSGAAEVLEGMAGISPITSGHLVLNGRSVSTRSPRSVMAAGVGYVPRDRRKEGLVLGLSVAENLHLHELASSKGWLVGWGARRRRSDRMVERFKVRTPDVDVPAGSLSGGNQQKLVMARVLGLDPRLLLLNEPTRGVDVGAKTEIFREVREYAKRKGTVIVCTSELADLIQICDRIVVFYRGRVIAEERADALDEDVLVRLASGGATPGPDEAAGSERQTTGVEGRERVKP